MLFLVFHRFFIFGLSIALTIYGQPVFKQFDENQSSERESWWYIEAASRIKDMNVYTCDKGEKRE